MSVLSGVVDFIVLLIVTFAFVVSWRVLMCCCCVLFVLFCVRVLFVRGLFLFVYVCSFLGGGGGVICDVVRFVCFSLLVFVLRCDCRRLVFVSWRVCFVCRCFCCPFALIVMFAFVGSWRALLCCRCFVCFLCVVLSVRVLLLFVFVCFVLFYLFVGEVVCVVLFVRVCVVL